MEKLDITMKSHTEEQIEKIATLFPHVITESRNDKGEVVKAIDFDLLKQELSFSLIEGTKERYQLTWPGKRGAIIESNAPTNQTLRPVREDSLDWDNTENLYIEGDNLTVLKILRETYLGKIKMIYIDPPYNTGKDFIYKDNFHQSTDEYLKDANIKDEEGNRWEQNTESNGRFHSDWLSMIYPRLKVARDLLKDDGVIFISIDDNEVHNLRKICDEIFGDENFVGNFCWKRRASSNLAEKNISTDHEYVLAFQKKEIKFIGIEKDFKGYSNPDNDFRGEWTTGDLTVGMTRDQRPNQYYELIDPTTGIKYLPNPNRVWAFIPNSMEKLIMEKRIIFPSDSLKRPMQKRFKNELKTESNPISTWVEAVGLNSEATRQLQKIFEGKYFDYAKPESLLKHLMIGSIGNNGLILDFFSGSATTAQAVMQLNADDEVVEKGSGNRKYVLVQVPEATADDSEACKAGYKNICEIGKERIRRAGAKIKAETGADIDYGFRVFRTDSTNFKEVAFSPSEYTQEVLIGAESNIKEDRTGEDVLIQVMLAWGLELSLPLEKKEIAGYTVYYVGGNSLVACLAKDVPLEVVETIAKDQPLRVVFLDSSFASDAERINVDAQFKLLSPETKVQVV